MVNQNVQYFIDIIVGNLNAPLLVNARFYEKRI